MNDRAKLDLGGFDAPTVGGRAERAREIGETHGFVSRDPAPAQARSIKGEGEGSASAVSEFRRPGRPQSNRLIAINTRVSAEAADRIYRLRDLRPRQGIADVIEAAVEYYEKALRDQGELS